MLNRAFFALQSPWIPTWVALAFNLTLNTLLYIPLLPRRYLGHPARDLALEHRRRARARDPAPAPPARRLEIGRTLSAQRGSSPLASLVLVGVSYGVWWALDDVLGDEFFDQLVAVGVALAAGGAVYLGACWLLRVRELRALLALRRARAAPDHRMDQAKIRNFSIIAHIDHGKSTLADRILELTETVTGREMREQLLDSMELERERGITIKAQAVRVAWKGHQLNLIDTPGHVDFHVRGVAFPPGLRGSAARRRRLAGQPGADARERVPGDRGEPRDRPGGEQDRPPAVAARRGRGRDRGARRGQRPSTCCASPPRPERVSPTRSTRIVERVPAPAGDPDAPPRALIFDSSYDQYRGVVAFVRVVDGTFTQRRRRCARWRPARSSRPRSSASCPRRWCRRRRCSAGEVGYLVTGLKDVSTGCASATRSRPVATARRSRSPATRT